MMHTRVLERGEIDEFKSRWPNHGLPNIDSIVFTYDSNHDLVDIGATGYSVDDDGVTTKFPLETSQFDGPALKALADAAECVYRFCITNGMPGYVPNNVQYFQCGPREVEGVIKDVVEDFISGIDNDLTVEDWRPWVHHGLRMLDASQWSFQLARVGSEILLLQGMTKEEYNEGTQNDD